MRSDLTCPIEVINVSITSEVRDNGQEQVVCLIDFHNLQEKVVDSVQMNIVCFDEENNRLGGRLVRAHARDARADFFSGAFRPEHVNGTSRVEASVEKIWFNDGILWRREERNVREYTPNNLPEGRELDRLRSVAGPDAAGYAEDQARAFLCVCGRANMLDRETCMRCGRDHADTVARFSRETIEATQGEKERQLEAQSLENLRRSTEQNVQTMEEKTRKQQKQKHTLRTVIILLLLLVIGLVAYRWGAPMVIDQLAARDVEAGHFEDAKKKYSLLLRYWPDEYNAAEKSLDAERDIIRGMLLASSREALSDARSRALAIQDEALATEAGLALAQYLIDSGDRDAAKTLLHEMQDHEAAVSLLNETLYQEGVEARDQVNYPLAIERFTELGDYIDSRTQRTESIYLYGRQLMREDRMEEAEAQFLQVADYENALSLVRSCRYAIAGNLRDSGELLQAAELFESLGIYEDAETQAKACHYEAGTLAFQKENLTEAAAQFKLAEDYEDAADQYLMVAGILGEAYLNGGDYESAVHWLEQLPLTGETLEKYHEALYLNAEALLKNGELAEAAVIFGSLGNYRDAHDRSLEIEYSIASSAMSQGALEEALDRFVALGDFSDSKTQAEACLEAIAERAFAAGDYETALGYYREIGTGEVERQIKRCLYSLGDAVASSNEYATAAAYYEECGNYLDAEEKAKEMHYREAEALENSGAYAQATEIYRSLGGYEDAAICVVRCEDAWLGEAYRNAKLDIETENYESAAEILKPYLDEDLPERYSDIPQMYEDACVSRAEQLIDMGHPLEALPYLEQFPNNRNAKKRLSDYVYQIIGRWKDKNGIEYIFRRDGTCSINGVERYFGGGTYRINVGDNPYPTDLAYQGINYRNNTLTILDVASEKQIRLNYLGEPTPKEEIVVNSDDSAEDGSMQENENEETT